MTIEAANNAHANYPPRAIATDPDVAWRSAATAVTATSTNLWSSYTGQDGSVNVPPAGKVWLELEATGFDVYVRFSRTGTTGTTTANGSVVKAGAAAVRYFIEPNVKDLFLDHISPGGVGALKWRVVSQVAERYRA